MDDILNKIEARKFACELQKLIDIYQDRENLNCENVPKTIYIYVCVSVYVYIYIYNHMHTHIQTHTLLIYLIFLTRETSHFPAMKVYMHSFNCYITSSSCESWMARNICSEIQDKIEQINKSHNSSQAVCDCLVLTSQI